MDQLSRYSGTTTNSVHIMQISTDGGTTWTNAITNGRVNHTHVNLQQAGIQLTTQSNISRDRFVAIVPPESTIEVCIRVGHFVVGVLSPASTHSLITTGSIKTDMRVL